MIAVAALNVSCKRERRTFRLPPRQTSATEAPPNTPLRAGGFRPNPATTQFAPGPPDDLEVNATTLAEGARLYQRMNCAGCHSANGGGAIGPALTDPKWIYGWKPRVIFESIVHGRPNGMPAFGGRISDAEVWKLVAFVRSLSGLGTPQSAPGREDSMAGATPPNSLSPSRPRSDRTMLIEMHERERTEFERRGWIDPRTGTTHIPDAIVNAVVQESAQSNGSAADGTTVGATAQKRR